MSFFKNFLFKIKLEIIKIFAYLHFKKVKQKKYKFSNANWDYSLSELEEYGLAKLPIQLDLSYINNLDDVLKLAKENYNNENLIVDHDFSKFSKYGKSYSKVSLNSKIFKALFSIDLNNFISSYYNDENFWLRNSPTIILDVKSKRIEQHSQSYYHLDYCEHQLSIIILLCDTNNHSSFTRYISKSHKLSWMFKNTNRTNVKFINRAKELEVFNPIKDIYGKKGEVFIFDAGNGLHKGIYGSDRYILHLNFARKRQYANYNENFEKEKIIEDQSGLNQWKIKPINSEMLNFYVQNNWKDKLLKYLIIKE
jgi:hypothetical protein